MFLIDDILLAPARGIMMVFREIHKAAQQEKTNEAESIRNQLSELYMELETGRMTEADFDSREKELLNRLDEIEGVAAPSQKEQLEKTPKEQPEKKNLAPPASTPKELSPWPDSVHHS